MIPITTLAPEIWRAMGNAGPCKNCVLVDEPAGVVRIYINGVEKTVKTGITQAMVQSAYDLYLGHRPASNHYPGALDAMGLYSRPLAARQVAAICEAGAAGKCFVLPPNTAPDQRRFSRAR